MQIWNHRRRGRKDWAEKISEYKNIQNSTKDINLQNSRNSRIQEIHSKQDKLKENHVKTYHKLKTKD